MREGLLLTCVPGTGQKMEESKTSILYTQQCLRWLEEPSTHTRVVLQVEILMKQILDRD
jgi:hypothetical protein